MDTISQPQVEAPPAWLSSLNAKLDSMSGDMRNMNGKINTMSGDITTMNGKINTLTGDMQNMNGAIQDMRGDITIIKNDLSDLNGRFNGLSERVDEQKIKIDLITIDITKTTVKIGELEQQVKHNSEDAKLEFTTLANEMEALKQSAQNTSDKVEGLREEIKVDLSHELSILVNDEISKRMGDESHHVSLETRSGRSESNSEDSAFGAADAALPIQSTPFAFARSPGVKAATSSMDQVRFNQRLSQTAVKERDKASFETPALGKLEKGVGVSGGGGGVQLAAAGATGVPPMPALIPTGRLPPDVDKSLLQPASERVASVSVTVKEIEERLAEVTLRTLKRLLYEVYVTYQRTSIDRSFSLLDHISRPVIEELVGDQRRKSFPCGYTVDMDNIFSVGDDEIVKRMLVEYVRPLSRNDFEQKLYGAVSPLPHPTEGRDFTQDYDRRMASKVDKVLHEVQTYVRLLREYATSDQLLNMPEMNWGKGEDNRGVIQMAMYCLRPYVANFKAMITGNAAETGGMKKLMECNTIAQWVEIIQKVNDLYSSQATLMRRLEMQSKPMEKAEVVQSKVEEQRMQKNFVNGKAEKLGLEGRRRTSAAGDLGRIEGWYLNEWGEYEPYREERLVRHPPQEPRHPPAELRRMINWEEPQYPRGPPQVRNFERLSGGRGYGELSQAGRGRGGGREMAMRGDAGRGRFGPVPPPGRDRGQGPRRGWLSPPAPQRPPKGFNENPLVCFKFAMGTCDKGRDCEYAHDPVLVKKYLARKVAYYTSSKWFDPSVKAEDPPVAQNFGITEEEWYELQRDDEECEDEQAVEPDYGYDDGGAGSFVEDHEAHWRS